MSALPRSKIIQAYRDLHKQALIAVNYSSPSRHILRDRIRKAFRKGHAADFDSVRIKNTVQFLRGASYNRTLEHRVLMTLTHTWRMRTYPRTEAQHLALFPKTPAKQLEVRRNAYDQFNHLVRMLNESMGMCLR